jgi:hypothetical protein
MLPTNNASVIAEMANTTSAHATVATVENDGIRAQIVADHAFVDIL